MKTNNIFNIVIASSLFWNLSAQACDDSDQREQKAKKWSGVHQTLDEKESSYEEMSKQTKKDMQDIWNNHVEKVGQDRIQKYENDNKDLIAKKTPLVLQAIANYAAVQNKIENETITQDLVDEYTTVADALMATEFVSNDLQEQIDRVCEREANLSDDIKSKMKSFGYPF